MSNLEVNVNVNMQVNLHVNLNVNCKIVYERDIRMYARTHIRT